MSDIAIQAINDKGLKENWNKDEKLINTCEFITSLDLDKDFKKFLEDKDKDSQRT
jgi:hypothetical protein